MTPGDIEARISQLFDKCEAELTQGRPANLDDANASLQDIVQLIPQLVASSDLSRADLHRVLTALQTRVARCGILLESAGAFHRGLAVRVGQTATSYSPDGVEVGLPETAPPTALHG